MTGMTRFATFWVENGEVVAPVNVMRFDDTLYSLFGTENLQHITKERQFLLSASSYSIVQQKAYDFLKCDYKYELHIIIRSYHVGRLLCFPYLCSLFRVI